MLFQNPEDTICALSTAQGIGAIGVIRVSGKKTLPIVQNCFDRSLSTLRGYDSKYGNFLYQEKVLDEVVLTFFRGPKSFTGEDTIEISFHGSPYVLQKGLETLVANGARLAGPGEFSQRAFFNQKLDLTQTEAIADLIASESQASHQMALKQLKGGFSKEIVVLKEKLIHFASLIELELDFSEEDVEFADRQDLKDLVTELQKAIAKLVDSFATGNALKKGIPVAIVGAPNSGKSTLLNALLNENKAIVSDIAGTTRDAIEDKITLAGVEYRFIDTAGIRETEDTIEMIGIERALEKANEAMLILHMVDGRDSVESIKAQKDALNKALAESKPVLTVVNKIDLLSQNPCDIEAMDVKFDLFSPVRYISASRLQNIPSLTDWLAEQMEDRLEMSDQSIVNNARHHAALCQTQEALHRVEEGLGNNVTGDFLAMDIRQALHYLGEITGEITTDDLLGNIFSRFCIGK